MSVWLHYKIKRGLAPRGRVSENFVPQPTTLVAKMIAGVFMRGKKDEKLSDTTRL